MTYSVKTNLFLLLLAAMIFCVPACGGSGGGDETDGDENICEPGLEFDEGKIGRAHV